MPVDEANPKSLARGIPLRVLWLVAIIGGAGFAALLIAMILASQRATAARDNAEGRQLHTYQVLLTAERLQSALFDAQRGIRGYSIVPNDAFLGPYRVAIDRVIPLATRLRRLTADDPVQRQRIARLDALIATQLDRLRGNVVDIRAGRSDRVLANLRSGDGEVNNTGIRDVVGSITAHERRLLDVRSAALRDAAAAADAAARSLSVVGIALLATALLAAFLALRTAMHARKVAGHAAELAAARRRLEAAVALRTAEIAAVNTALKDEIAAKQDAEAQVRQMQKLESVGQLTGGIAHDFNNMLAIVIGSIDLAQRRLDDPTGRVVKYLDNAMDGARRAATLTARLLAFSRQQPLAPEPIDANVFVGNISELLRQTLGEGIQIETVLAGGLWRSYADAAELENAILNLAVNARDAMDGEGKLTIETANTHLDDAYAAAHAEVIAGQYVAVCVTDTGGGMPPEVAAKAFDPFFTTKPVGKGTGLGLSQVYGFVRQSGGHVKIYSEPGEGTTVKLYLPRWIGVAGAARAAVPDGELPRARDGETVLVVEDEANVRVVTVDALRDLGYEVVHAGDADAALALLETTPRVDLLFTDIVMPGRNGRELAEAALSARDGLRVLYTTGYMRNAVVHNGMLDAQVAFLPKPFSVASLAVKVRAVLDGGGANRVA